MNTNSEQTEVAEATRVHGRAGAASLWLGYAPTGGRVWLRFDELKRRLLIGGHSADSVASLLAYACNQAGLNALVLDADGHLAERVSGYFQTYDYTCFLYDAFQLDDEDPPRHSQLIAAAYTAALDLTSEEEAIVNAGMQQLAMKDTVASPTVLFNALEAVEGFRGFYVDKLKGRIGGLKFLEGAENASFKSLLELGNCLVTFRGTKYPQAMEVAVAIFLAKLIAGLPRAKVKPDLVIINDAHRVFRAAPRPLHSNRLLTELMDSGITVVLASDQVHAISEVVLRSFSTKLLSSDVWNERTKDYRYRSTTPEFEPVLPNAMVIEDGHFGHIRSFIPRLFEERTSEPRTGPVVDERMKSADNKLTALILQDIASYEAPTRDSLLGFISAEYDPEVVKHELDRLHQQGLIELEKKAVRGGGEEMLVYSITDAGRRLLEAMGN